MALITFRVHVSWVLVTVLITFNSLRTMLWVGFVDAVYLGQSSKQSKNLITLFRSMHQGNGLLLYPNVGVERMRPHINFITAMVFLPKVQSIPFTLSGLQPCRAPKTRRRYQIRRTYTNIHVCPQSYISFETFSEQPSRISSKINIFTRIDGASELSWRSIECQHT